ncbi:cell division protein FtsX [Chryseosolibacter indicus]|uniref:Cell division protein FtsX n=1 Tax=Chryseosolibacter indicus TaxID=2782351 RepID=A0ABS5VXJ7_9BACT|nr:permease-like cell division protein FtsX [Chryseosolibacter indicus]MBT1706135.1 permease-like cell division protein FtsX [Chryseosolibacter indicus]
MEKATRKKKLGGYPAVGVMLSVTLALFVIGLFGLLMLYSKKLEQQIRQNIRMQVYLKSNLTNAQRLQIENKLLALPYISQEAGEKITFVSKDEAAKKFIAETGEDFTKFIGENPLRDAYLITIDPDYHTKEKMDSIKTGIQKMTGVFQVYYVEGVIEAVNENVTKIGLFLAGLIVILLITVVLLINNTLRIALFSQRFLIRSMQLVGATSWFIQRPFLFRAAGYGFVGGLVAGGLLWLLSDYAQGKIIDLRTLHNPDDFLKLILLILILGVVITVASTLASIHKYLRMSLDELY